MRRALVALVAIAILGTGTALSVSVPVLTVTDGGRRFTAVLRDGERLVYSYRQSIYGVTVDEEFARDGDALDLRRVRAADIRAIEYFRWDTPIERDGEAFVTVPPATRVPELVLRLTASGEQRLRATGWLVVLRERFGEDVVHVRLERPSLLAALADGVVW